MAQKKRNPTSFSLTEKATDLLTMLADHYGISRTSVIEMLVREESRKLGVE